MFVSFFLVEKKKKGGGGEGKGKEGEKWFSFGGVFHNMYATCKYIR